MQLEKIQHALPKIPELVMQTLIAAIDRGDVNVGEELPSERDLAEMLGVGRGSLRECLAILEFLGAIENRGNRKVVIRDADYIQKSISFVRVSNSRIFRRISASFAGSTRWLLRVLPANGPRRRIWRPWRRLSACWRTTRQTI